MKKLLVTLCVALMLVTSVFANGTPEEADDTPITINFWTHEDSNRTALEDKLIAEYEAAHPNVDIVPSRQSSKEMPKLVNTAFAAENGPTIFNLDIPEGEKYVLRGLVAPVDYKAAGYKNAEDLISSYTDHSLDPVVVDGEVYGLPLEVTNWVIYVNKAVMREAGLDPEKDMPKTWEDMVRVSDAMCKRNGDILEGRGFDFRYGYNLEVFVPMVEQLGGALFGEDGEVMPGKDAWVKVLTFIQDWGPNGKNLGSPTYTPARKLFNKANGDMGMCITGLYQAARIKSENPDFYNSGDLEVIPFPQFEDAQKHVSAAYYGHYYMVNGEADERTQAAAWDFIAFMLEHGEDYLEQCSLVQPKKALMESEAFKNTPFSNVVEDDLQYSNLVYCKEGASEIQAALKEAVNNLMQSDVDPEAVYYQLKDQIQEIKDEF